MLGNSGTLVDTCRKRLWPELCTYLEQGYLVNVSDGTGVTPLQICAALGWTEAVSLLLKHGADLQSSCPLGWTALMQAARNGHANVVRMLIDAGAKTTGRNSLGWDVMSLAIASQNEELVTMLIPTAKADELNSALALACQLGIVHTVKCLLNQHVDVNSTLPDSGVTPLMLAACEGYKSIVEMLLSDGADPHLTNASNLTALDMAVMNAHSDIEALLSPYLESKPKLRPTLVLPTLSLPIVASYKSVATCSYKSNVSSGYPDRSPFPYTPVYQTLKVESHSPQIFKFPPSPSCGSSSPNHLSFQYPAFSSHLAQNVSPSYFFPPDSFHLSPTFCSSPLVPPWMFAYGHWHHKVESKPVIKSRKKLRNWWRKLKKRCKGKKQKKRIKVYVTFDEDDKDPAEMHMEALLRALDMDSLAPILKSHEIDVETFLNLRKEDLEELGIVDKVHQFLILQKINSLNGNVIR